MAPAVWYRRGSFCRGSGRPDRPDFGAELLEGAAAAETAEESSAKSGSGEASEAPRVSQLSPEGDGGMPGDKRDEAGQMKSIKEASRCTNVMPNLSESKGPHYLFMALFLFFT